MNSSTTHIDQRLIKGIARNDRAVMTEIYERFLGKIIAFVEQNSGSEADARDLFQEALIAIFSKARKGELELSSSFYTYLYAVCRNLWLKKLRKNKGKEVTLDPELVSSDERASELDLDEQDRMRLYRAKFSLLGEDCRKLLQLFFEGISMSEIAAKLGFASEGYAKKRKFQCKQKLVTAIQSDPLYKELIN